MNNYSSHFGDYLKILIKEAGLTQTEFYMTLGIKKPYFYDILSGRIQPPPHAIQFRTVEILNVDEKTKEKLFDLAAKEREDVPADITRTIKDNPVAISRIRNELRQIESVTTPAED